MAAKRVSARARKAKKPKGGGGKAGKAATAEKVVVAPEAVVEPVAVAQEVGKGLPTRKRVKEATAPALRAWRCEVCKGGHILIDKPIICPTCYTQGSIRAVEAAVKPAPPPAELPDVLDNSAEAVVDRMTAKATATPVVEKVAETYYQQPPAPQGPETKAAPLPTVDDRATEIDELVFDNRTLTMLSDVEPEDFDRFPSHIKALDRALDGGLVAGGVIMFAGEKGVGKTTLWTHVVMEHAVRYKDAKIFLASGEESLGRFKPRAKRLGYTDAQIKLACRKIGGCRLKNIEAVHTEVEKMGNVTMIVYDSLPKKFLSPSVKASKPELHVVEVINEIVDFAGAYGSCAIVVGRLTQDGKVAGGEDYLYDLDGAVLRINRVYKPSGKRNVPPIKTGYISIKSDKNRFGAEDRIGWMKKGAEGLRSCGRPTFMAPINSRD